MKRTLRTKIWCGVLAVACVSGVAFGAANLPRVQAEAVSGGIKVTEAPMTKKEEYRAAREKFESAEEQCFPSADLSNVPKIVKNEDGGIAAENGSLDFSACVGGELAEVSLYGGKNVTATVLDVHVSDHLEYGLVQDDSEDIIPWWFKGRYPWLETCELGADGKLSSPHYALAYVTVRFENTGEETSGVTTGSYVIKQYNDSGYCLDQFECCTDKRELVNGKVEIPANAEDPNKTGNIILEPGKPREFTFVYFVSDRFIQPYADTDAAECDGVTDYIETLANYATMTYEETDCRYTFEFIDSENEPARYNVSDIVNDFFTEHK